MLSPASTSWISSLNHELLYHSMELCVIVVASSGQLGEVSKKHLVIIDLAERILTTCR